MAHFAQQLQQAIGGAEGEIRVCLQYFFQAWGARGPAKYGDVLLNTATEEISHIELLATAVALNLENAPATMQETTLQANPVVAAVMGGGERPATSSRACCSGTFFRQEWLRFPQIATAFRLIVRMSMRAEIWLRICTVTWRRRPRDGHWPFASTIPRAIQACRTC